MVNFNISSVNIINIVTKEKFIQELKSRLNGIELANISDLYDIVYDIVK